MQRGRLLLAQSLTRYKTKRFQQGKRRGGCTTNCTKAGCPDVCSLTAERAEKAQSPQRKTVLCVLCAFSANFAVRSPLVQMAVHPAKDTLSSNFEDFDFPVSHYRPLGMRRFSAKFDEPAPGQEAGLDNELAGLYCGAVS